MIIILLTILLILIYKNSKRKKKVVSFVKSDYEYKNIKIIVSEYPCSGELLPYIYFLRNKWFSNAVILHDSVFFHKRISFNKITEPVLPLWHFNPDMDNLHNSLHLISRMRNTYSIQSNLSLNGIVILGRKHEWTGCFGVQSYISHNFLVKITEKYNLFSLLENVKSRPDRCCLERIFGIIFTLESGITKKQKSLFGNIHQYNSGFDYTYEKYKYDLTVRKKLPKGVIKVWTGR
jgi:hypothetical protein